MLKKARLAQIVSRVLRHLYSIRPISTNRRTQLTKDISEDLNKWRLELSRFLDADIFSSSFVIPLLQRQRNVLNLTYWHVVVLTHRPFFLSSFARRGSEAMQSNEVVQQTSESVQECLKAAMTIANTIDEISQKQQMFRAFWVMQNDHYQAPVLTRFRSLPILHSRQTSFSISTFASERLPERKIWTRTFLPHLGVRLTSQQSPSKGLFLSDTA